nr:hypothetical protein B0A51_03151 [Rachicladosporium sp. CCFEE 5018]
MSGYEVEHGIKPPTTPQPPPRRPDLSTFFSALSQVDTSGSRQPQNANSIPLPTDVSAAYRLLANAFDMMRGGGSSASNLPHDELMESLISSLMENAEHPPTEVQGVPDEFISELERVPKGKLTEDMSCPICGNPFLDDKYPLVVRLPCHKDHLFDLECIEPWLKLQPTCPLDRKTIWKKKEAPKKEELEDGEEEFDDMYA